MLFPVSLPFSLEPTPVTLYPDLSITVFLARSPVLTSLPNSNINSQFLSYSNSSTWLSWSLPPWNSSLGLWYLRKRKGRSNKVYDTPWEPSVLVLRNTDSVVLWKVSGQDVKNQVLNIKFETVIEYLSKYAIRRIAFNFLTHLMNDQLWKSFNQCSATTFTKLRPTQKGLGCPYRPEIATCF